MSDVISSSGKILLCSDLDRTILPNGAQPESPQARSILHKIAMRPELCLAYVSGRHEQLLRQAITDYKIPVPDYAIGDVGTTIYRIEGDKWSPWQDWSTAIQPDWAGATHGDLRELFSDIDALQLQEAEKQNTFKLSYYTAVAFDQEVIPEMQSRLKSQGVKASLIWSIDEEAATGLLDVLPLSATKLHAVEFLMAQLGFNTSNTVFAGDSGNDLPVLCSGRLQAVLVKNAHPDVITEATSSLTAINELSKLYVAQGDFREMNGNYSAGVVEGLVHFIPRVEKWLD